MDPNFENQKTIFRKKISGLHYDQKNTLNPLVKSVLKSVHNYWRYLQFCDRRVCSFHHVATRRLRAWPILRTRLRPVQLFLVSFYSFLAVSFISIFQFFGGQSGPVRELVPSYRSPRPCPTLHIHSLYNFYRATMMIKGS